MTVPLEFALLSAAALGFRHGLDHDHIAVISDIASVQDSAPGAMKLGLLYALAHGATVALLGSLVILFQLSLPGRADRTAEVVVGITLIVLASYVLACTIMKRHRSQSRVLLLIAAARWLRWRFERWRDPQLAPPTSFTWNYDRKSVFTVGVIHGLGAETPTQLMILLLAANLGGIGKGFLGLSMFLVGLLVMNTLMIAGAAGLFQLGTGMPWLQRVAMSLAAAYSLVVGVVFVLGRSSILPAFGG